MIVTKTIRRSGNLRLRGLSGLGGLDLDSNLVIGGSYIFYFTYGGIGLSVDPNDVTKWVASDTNFKNPVTSVKPGGLFGGNQIQISFTYSGRGSNVRNAGAEMQNVINSRLSLTQLYFDSADGGASVAGSNNGASSFDPSQIASYVNSAVQAALGSKQNSSGGSAIPWGTILLVGGGLLVGGVVAVKVFK